jgi:3-mercaptopyruvate sulfurtransferase SseA
MNKNILLFLTILFSISSSHAFESSLLEPEVAVKMINSKKIQFISIGREKSRIVGSQNVDLHGLVDIDVVGRMECEPFLICPKKLKKYFESRGIGSNQELILYDNQYGIDSATLYWVLKSIGHSRVKILNGDYQSIEKLDPNQKTYDKYLSEKRVSLSCENNDSTKEKAQEVLESLNRKLSVLKPLLLVQEPKEKILDYNVTYTLERSKFNFDFFIDRDFLKKAVAKVRMLGKESNISIVDACSMIDIVGNTDGSYLPGVDSFDWKELIGGENKILKTRESLIEIFEKKELDKMNDIYVYCMENSQKAFYLALGLHEAGYKKVKIFSGNWSVWKGDNIE